jgi:hypothetical protein
MKVLVIIISHEMNSSFLSNITILDKFMKDSGNTVDYAGISSTNDFGNFEGILEFKYKFICQDKQLTKLCKFITNFRNFLDYDWYLKTRPEIKLLDQIDFSQLDSTAMNARARNYKGPRYIKFGSSVPSNFPAHMSIYSPVEEIVILDDQIYMFHNTLISKGCFDKVPMIENMFLENEWYHTEYWKSQNIPLKVVGIHVVFNKYSESESLDLTPKRIGFYTNGKLINNVPPAL